MDLKGPPAELRITLEITRAATGKTETVELVGYPDPEDLDAVKETKSGGQEDE